MKITDLTRRYEKKYLKAREREKHNKNEEVSQRAAWKGDQCGQLEEGGTQNRGKQDLCSKRHETGHSLTKNITNRENENYREPEDCQICNADVRQGVKLGWDGTGRVVVVTETNRKVNTAVRSCEGGSKTKCTMRTAKKTERKSKTLR